MRALNHCRATALIACLLGMWCPAASARVALVVGEPFGSFGTMLPVGHASVYLDHVCAASPTRLRPCRAGEAGVVVSRYHDLRSTQLDWLATPARIFFYGTESADAIPAYMTASQEWAMRERYRRRYLMAEVPDMPDRQGRLGPPHDARDWSESIGAAFDRRLLIYSMASTAAQDAAIMARLNDGPNVRRYTLGRANCADFAADLIGMVLGERPRPNFFGDYDFTTPKNLARILDRAGRTEAALGLEVMAVPQLPGSLRRSRPLRGSAETLVKTKRYVLALAVLQPEALLADWVCYEAKGRWKPGLDARVVTPAAWPAASGGADDAPAKPGVNASGEGSGG